MTQEILSMRTHLSIDHRAHADTLLLKLDHLERCQHIQVSGTTEEASAPSAADTATPALPFDDPQRCSRATTSPTLRPRRGRPGRRRTHRDAGRGGPTGSRTPGRAALPVVAGEALRHQRRAVVRQRRREGAGLHRALRREPPTGRAGSCRGLCGVCCRRCLAAAAPVRPRDAAGPGPGRLNLRVRFGARIRPPPWARSTGTGSTATPRNLS